MGHTESSPANSFKISTDSSLYAAACRRLLLIWAKKSLLSCCPNKYGDHCGLMRNEQGQICPYTMTFLHAGNTRSPWNIWKFWNSSNSGQVASTGRSRAARQQARLLYAVAVSMVSLGSPKAWNFVAKILMFPQSTNFPRYPWNVPQTLKQQFMFGKSLSFGNAWGCLGYVGIRHSLWQRPRSWTHQVPFPGWI